MHNNDTNTRSQAEPAQYVTIKKAVRSDDLRKSPSQKYFCNIGTEHHESRMSVDIATTKGAVLRKTAFGVFEI